MGLASQPPLPVLQSGPAVINSRGWTTRNGEGNHQSPDRASWGDRSGVQTLTAAWRQGCPGRSFLYHKQLRTASYAGRLRSCVTTASLQKSGSLPETRGGFKLHYFKEDLTRGLFTKLKSGYVERTRGIRCRAVTLPSASRARRLEVGASCGDRHLQEGCALGSRGSRSAATLR